MRKDRENIFDVPAAWPRWLEGLAIASGFVVLGAGLYVIAPHLSTSTIILIVSVALGLVAIR